MYVDVIDPVIKVLRQTLRMVRGFEGAQKKVDTLHGVLRKLMVMRELYTTPFVTVAGIQGVGKTKLICELYSLEAWLEDNSGRGEKRPLFVIESDCDEPYAEGVNAEGDKEVIDRATLQQELKSFSAEMRYQLLRLYVPRQSVSPGISYLLLPGYERLNASNEHWQEEMRDTLRHSVGSILVTDQTRMANHATVGILDDLLKSCLANRSPIIAITHTEGKTDEERQELRRTAAEVCHVEAGEMDRVVCTGVGEAWREQWVPAFTTSLHNYIKPSSEVSRQRLNDLKNLMDEELGEAVFMLEEMVGAVAARQSGQELLLDDIMKKFRGSAEKYRRGLERQLRERSQAYANLVTEAARQQYVAEEEGFANKASNLGSKLTLKSSEIEQRFVRRVTDNWASQGERTPLEVTYLALTDMANRNLVLGYNGRRVPKEADLAQACAHGLPSLLGYENSGKTVKLFKKELDSLQLHSSLRLLLQEIPSDIDALDHDRATSREISTALELLPTLAMEFLRVAQAGVLTAKPEMLPELREQQIEPEKIFEVTAKGFSGMAQSVKEILGTVLAISAVDIGIDGSFDIGTVLAGGAVSGLGAQLSLAAACVIGLAYVSFKVSEAVHQYDTEKKNFIAFCVDHLASQQVEQTLLTYDDIMEQLQDRLTQNLSRAYGIDKELFSERDAMARALYALKIASRDLSEEIDRAQRAYLV